MPTDGPQKCVDEQRPVHAQLTDDAASREAGECAKAEESSAAEARTAFLDQLLTKTKQPSAQSCAPVVGIADGLCWGGNSGFTTR
jgi:hypothetical protein